MARRRQRGLGLGSSVDAHEKRLTTADRLVVEFGSEAIRHAEAGRCEIAYKNITQMHDWMGQSRAEGAAIKHGPDTKLEEHAVRAHDNLKRNCLR